MDRRSRAALIAGFILLLCAPASVRRASASEWQGAFEIEQIQAEMPNLTVYLRGEGAKRAEDLEIRLDEELLEVESVQTFEESGGEICYFLLIDISGSIPNDAFEAEKGALTAFVQSLGGQECVIFSFGTEVRLEWRGTGEDAEGAAEAIGHLRNRDQETHLFEAVEMAADVADGIASSVRKILLVFSDGEDFATGLTTRGEMQEKLSARSIPLYAFGVSNAKKEYLDSFGEMARSLGGELYLFSAANLAERIEELGQSLAETLVVHSRAATNEIDYRSHVCTVRLSESGVSRSREVVLNAFVPDEAPPEILAVEKLGEHEIRIAYSEAVRNGDDPDRYRVTRDGEELALESAAYAEGGKAALLRFREELYTGDYRIETTGICDASMEENPVSGAFETRLSGGAPPAEPEEEPTDTADEGGSGPDAGDGSAQMWLLRYGWVIALAAVLFLAGVLLLIWRKLRRERAVVTVDGKVVLTGNVQEKQRFRVEQSRGRPITLELLNASGTSPKRIEASVDGSLIVGRAEHCDLSFDDTSLSKQHFALEEENGKLYITDLETTNGTSVNGVKLGKRHLLASGDSIEAGRLRMRIVFR